MAQTSYSTITITDTADIESVSLIYKGSSSNTVAPSIIWTGNTNDWTTDVSQINDPYIWSITVFKYTGIAITSQNYSDYYSDPVCLTGIPGQSVSVESIKYSSSFTEAQPADSTFTQNNPPSNIPEGGYLWSRTLLSNGQSIYSKAKQGKSPTVSKTGNTVTITDASGNTVTITDGSNGQSYYTFVRYSANANGSNYSTDPTGKSYIGIYTGTETSPPTYSNSGWHWTKYTGEQGISVTGVKEVYYLTIGSAPTQNTLSNGTAITNTTDATDVWTTIVPTYVVNGTYYKSLQTSLSGGTTPVFSAIVLDEALTTASYNAFVAQSIAQQATEDAQGAMSQASEAQYQSEALDAKLKTFFWPGDTTTGNGIYRGAYAVSGRESESPSVTLDITNISTYGFNVAIKPASISIGYNAIKALELDGSTPALKFYVPSKTTQASNPSMVLNSSALVFNKIGTGNKSLELTSTALNFYGSSTSTADVTLTSSGLNITNGSIQLGNGGSSGTSSGNITLSNVDFNRSINSIPRTGLRLAIGSNFGVKNDGTLYANNAVISGQITVGSGSNVYTTDDVNPLEIGGKNLLRHTKDLSGWTLSNSSSGASYQTVTLSDGEPTCIVNFPNTSSGTVYEYINSMNARFPYSFIRNQSIIISADVLATNGVITGALIELGLYANETDGSRLKYLNRNVTISGTGNWEKITLQLDITDDAFTVSSGTVDFNTCYVRFAFFKAYDKGYTAGFQLRKLKLEVGNVATDWSPAPEDVEEEISNADTNMLLDWNAPTLTAYKAPANRYFSNASNTWCTPTMIEISDPPEPSIKYGARMVGDGTNTSAANRGMAFYITENLTNLRLRVGCKYTVSVWARKTSGSASISCAVRHNGSSWLTAISSKSLTTDWQRYYGVFEYTTVADYNRVIFQAIFSGNTAGTVEMCGFKLVANGDSSEATTYITAIDNNDGIKVHAANNINSNYAKINADGMEIYKGGYSVAQYGDTARIGRINNSRFLINANSLQGYNDDNDLYFNVSEEGVNFLVEQSNGTKSLTSVVTIKELSDLATDTQTTFAKIEKTLTNTSNQISSILTNLNRTSNIVDKLNQYISINDSNNILILGKNNYTITINTQESSFKYNNVEVMAIRSDKLYIKDAELLNTFKMGNFVWQPIDGQLVLMATPTT